jgi:hypothetical protein
VTTRNERRVKMMDDIWANQITLPDEIEKWVVSVLRVQEFTYTKKIPEKNLFRVSMALGDLERAFAKREVAKRCKENPKRYGHRRGCRWMFLSSTTALLVGAANALRRALKEPEFEWDRKTHE